MTDDDLGIPPTLKRSPRGLTPAELNAEIARLNAKSKQDSAIKWKDENAPPPSPARLAQQERSREKSRVRIERLLAKKSGATTRMPLTGKQAWEKIMNDDATGPKETALREAREEGVDQAPARKKRERKPNKPEPDTSTGVNVDPEPEARTTEEKTVKKTKTKSPKPKGNGAIAAKTGKTKVEIIKGLLTRAKGCTTKDVLEATGWPTVSMPQQAKAAGLTLRKEKTGSVTRYFASE